MLNSKTNLLAILLTLLFPPTITSSTIPPQDQHVLLPNHASNSKPQETLGTLRDVEHRDLPAIATIWVDAFLPSPLYDYLIPNPKAHRQDIWNCLHYQLEAAWPFNHTLFHAKVIAVPTTDHDADNNPATEQEQQNDDKAVAFALWHVIPGAKQDDNDHDENQQEQEQEANAKAKAKAPPPFPHLPFSPPPSSLFPSNPSKLPTTTTTTTSSSCSSPHCPHSYPRGTNLTHVHSFQKKMSAIDREFFSPSTHPSGQLHLQVLATHPSWDGNGFAARHVRWGMELATRGLGRSLPVTLLASPAGFHVYDGEGFRGLRNVSIERLDGGKGLWFEVMEWEGEGE